MDKAMDVVGRFWKAVVAFAVPAAVVTTGEWVTAACAAIITAGAVGAVKNRQKVSP